MAKIIELKILENVHERWENDIEYLHRYLHEPISVDDLRWIDRTEVTTKKYKNFKLMTGRDQEENFYLNIEDAKVVLPIINLIIEDKLYNLRNKNNSLENILCLNKTTVKNLRDMNNNYINAIKKQNKLIEYLELSWYKKLFKRRKDYEK